MAEILFAVGILLILAVIIILGYSLDKTIKRWQERQEKNDEDNDAI